MARRKTKASTDTPKVSASTMAHASKKASERLQSSMGAFYGGNIGDSIERRLSAFDYPSNFLGGGSGHTYEGANGLQGYWGAQGWGMQYGLGQGFGGRNGPFSGGGGRGGFHYLRAFSGNSSFNHQIIAQCMLAYYTEGIVNRVVNIFADFATEGLDIVSESESTQNIINAWMQKTKIKERVRTFFMTMFATGNVFIHRRWAKLGDGDVRALRRYNTRVFANDELYVDTGKKHRKIDAKNEGFGSFVAEAAVDGDEFLNGGQPETEKNTIPWGYSALNPLQMDLRGGKFRGTNHWVMLLSKKDVREYRKFLESYGGNIAQSGGTLPPELEAKYEEAIKGLKERLKPAQEKSGGTGHAAELELTDEDLYVLQDSKFDWNDWAVPFVYPALRHIHFKHCLRNMELRACETVINTIFLFKLGNIEKGLPAEEEHFERLGDMLQMPGNAMNIIWNEAIEGEVLQTDVAKLFDPKKHESADRDILTSLGIPAVLLGGTGGSFASSFVAVAAVLERLESARDSISCWLMSELKILADALGFRKLPSIRWGRNSLRDQSQWLNLVMALADRGVLSKDTLLKEFGISDFNIEVEKQIGEQQRVEEEDPQVMPHQGPFVKDSMVETRTAERQIEQDGMRKEADLDFQEENVERVAKINEKLAPPEPAGQPGAKGPPGAKPKTPNGRPPGSKTKDSGAPPKKQSKPRSPTGQSVADIDLYEEIKTEGATLLAQVEELVNERFRKARGLKYVKEAKKEERENLENCIYHIFSHMPAQRPDAFNADDYIVNLVRSDTLDTVKADVLQSYNDKVARYAAKFGKEPTREHRRQFIISAWTQCALNQHVG